MWHFTTARSGNSVHEAIDKLIEIVLEVREKELLERAARRKHRYYFYWAICAKQRLGIRKVHQTVHQNQESAHLKCYAPYQRRER